MVPRFRSLLLAVCLAVPLAAQQPQISANALGGSASRYLRDAAASPVAWQPWGEAAFDLAKRGDRPIFLNIGFASSFEAFLMHRDVFNKAEVAETLNGSFVPVLLDRFEHPEIAEAFDTLQKSMTGSVSHPSSFVLTHGLEPIAVSGALGPKDFNTFLSTNASRWATQREAAVAEARAALVKAHLLGEQRGPANYDAQTLPAVIADVAKSFDPNHPRPAAVSFALRFGTTAENNAVRAVALEALRKFARSAVRDQLGGGFHRNGGVYDKLLADQALYAMAYLEAWQMTGDAEFEDVVRTTLDYVVRDLHGTRSAFDTSQDAHGLVPGQGPVFVEGAFYLWSQAEITKLVGFDDAKKIFRVFGIESAQNNRPIRTERIPDELKPAVQKLFELRQKRPEPFREFNQLASWNGLMISALARAGAAFGEQRYTDAALAAARTVTSKLWDAKKKTLHHSDAATAARVEGIAEDYAMVVQGLIDLFEATHDVKWLELAQTIQQRQDELFWNASTGRYNTGTSVPEQLRGLLVESDELTPSVNSIAAMNLLRLTLLTGNPTWSARPTMIFQSFGMKLRNAGGQVPQLASALSMSLATPKVVVVTGNARVKAPYDVLRGVHQRWDPFRIVVFVPEKGIERTRITTALPFTNLPPDPEQPLTYVCEKGECRRQ